MTFQVRAHEFHFRAADSVYFPPLKAGNVFRGALWPAISDLTVSSAPRPSGLARPPQPFVLRVSHLDGKRIEAGDTFSIRMHLFDLHRPLIDGFIEAFSSWAEAGLGPGRARVHLIASSQPGVETTIDLHPGAAAARCKVTFVTPTELKGMHDTSSIPFGVLFARIRDRISTLRTLYGEGTIAIDFRGMAERANLVATTATALSYCEVVRRSSRTSLVHGIGGLMGAASYAGEVTEFIPWLKAAWWTGVGRHTVWGNGLIEVSVD